ncbi:hypothetical protein FQR65_LT15383 [Abscondita terminalis]|nr:hypothetical protein FQR65_LT15383 [Abscondita terminalis]
MTYGCRLKLENALNVIIATAVLHNIAQEAKEGEPPCPENINIYGLEQLINDGQIPHVPLPNGGVAIAAATAVLHNIAQEAKEGEPPCPENINIYGLEQLINDGQIPHVPLPNGGVAIAAGVRNNFIYHYFENL